MKKTSPKKVLSLSKIEPIKIKNEAGMLVAVETLSKLNKTLDSVVTEREKLTKPLNETLREIRGRYKPVESKLEEAISQVRGEMSRYQTALLAEVKAKEEKAAQDLVKGDINLEKAVAVVEKAGAKIVEKVETTSGSVAFRTDKVLRIVDASLVPREYLIVDEKAVKNTLLAGGVIAGCVLDEVQVPINRR